MFLPPSSCSSSRLKLLQNSGHVGETGRDAARAGEVARSRFVTKDVGSDKGNYDKRTRWRAEGPEKTQVLCPRRTVVALAVCLWQQPSNPLSVSALVFFFYCFVFLPVTETSTLITECLSSNTSLLLSPLFCLESRYSRLQMSKCQPRLPLRVPA